MGQTFNIYCDESCHLENDKQKAMVIGGVWCPLDKAREISIRIRELKKKHNLSEWFEIKWTKVSPAKIQFYLDIIDYFFDDDDLHFRALIIPDKSQLDHKRFNQTHDDFYYKICFDMLKTILNPDDQYRIYFDIKDTRSAIKIKKLHEILRNNIYDFSGEIIEKVQQVRSHEVNILQLTDLLIGAIGYLNRGMTESTAKLSLIERIKKRSGYDLTRTTLYRENKVNLLRWSPKESIE